MAFLVGTSETNTDTCESILDAGDMLGRFWCSEETKSVASDHDMTDTTATRKQLEVPKSSTVDTTSVRREPSIVDMMAMCEDLTKGGGKRLITRRTNESKRMTIEAMTTACNSLVRASFPLGVNAPTQRINSTVV